MDEINATIERLLQTYGSEIHRDKRRFVALLRDMLSRRAHGWRFNLLILSIESGQLERLMSQSSALPLNILLENHCRSFSESYRIEPAAARWVIETWIACFDLRTPAAKRRHHAPAAPKPRPVAAQPVAPPPQKAQLQPVTLPTADQNRFRNGLGMEFVRIDPGHFRMGSPLDESGRDSSEVQHEVSLTRSFYLQTTPVTQAQWEQLMGSNPSARRGDQHPVEKVSWAQCQDFIAALSRAEPIHYRLPTEAEWEYAARAGRPGTYFFGATARDLGDYAWFADNAGGSTQPVGQKQPNPWGLLDIYGNVKEWCADWYAPHSNVSQIDPIGPATGAYRVCRGGSWRLASPGCRSASRLLMRPGVTMDDLGFRLALDL